MKSPDAGMNVSNVPANTPGSESGKITVRNVRPKLEYRSAAASIRLVWIFSRLT